MKKEDCQIDKELTEITQQILKALKVEEWVRITFIRIPENQRSENSIELSAYNIPRKMLERWQWLFNWKQAKYTCIYPKDRIYKYYSHYDKTTGYGLNLKTPYQNWISTKAQCTKQKNILKRYEEEKKKTLFPNLENDEKYLKIKRKVRLYEEKLSEAAQTYKNAAELIKVNLSI